MGQLGQAEDDVADGEDSGLRGLLRVIYLDQAALQLDFGLFEADAAGTAVAADCDEDLLGFLDLRLAVGVGVGDFHASFGLLDGLDFGACVDVDAALLEEPR